MSTTKFRKKPIAIEAQQWFPGVEIEGVITDPFDLVDVPGATMAHQIELQDGRSGAIQTLEGVMYVSPGDWIITGVAGEKYPCKPDIFEQTYEAVV